MITLTRRSTRARYAGRYRYADWKGDTFRGPRASWQPPRDDEESANLYGWKPHSQVYMAMPPQDALEIARRIWEGQGDRFSDTDWAELLTRHETEALAERMRRGEPIDAAFFDYDVAKHRFRSQEGAHRTVTALQLGLTEMPVIVYARHEGSYVAPTPAMLRDLRRWGRIISVGGTGDYRTRSSGRDLQRLAHERLGGFERDTLVHGWLLPDGKTIHGTHPGIRDLLGTDYDELWDAGFARVLISNHRVGVETERPLTAAQRATITEFADRSPLPLLIEVRDSDHHIVWGDQVGRTMSIERLLREANQHAERNPS